MNKSAIHITGQYAKDNREAARIIIERDDTGFMCEWAELVLSRQAGAEGSSKGKEEGNAGTTIGEL